MVRAGDDRQKAVCVARQLQSPRDGQIVLQRKLVEVRKSFFHADDPRHAVDVVRHIGDGNRQSRNGRDIKRLRELDIIRPGNGVGTGGAVQVGVAGDINVARAVRAEQRTEDGGIKIRGRGVKDVCRDLQQPLDGRCIDELAVHINRDVADSKGLGRGGAEIVGVGGKILVEPVRGGFAQQPVGDGVEKTHGTFHVENRGGAQGRRHQH